MKYPHNPIDAFQNGAILSLEVRIALELLKSSPMFHGIAGAPLEPELAKKVPLAVAVFALDAAEALLEEGVRRGFVEAMPDGTDLAAPVKKHAARMGKFQATQQIAGQSELRDLSGPVAVPRGMQ